MSKYVVVDLEMCKVPCSKRKLCCCTNEIIEIGAVLVDDSLNISDRFRTYVSPEYGVIDSQIENLTGITNECTIGAPRLEKALGMFFEWMPEDSTIISWSENDEKQLRRETESKGIYISELDSMFEDSIDCQAVFSERMNSPKVYRLSEALAIADIEYDENLHEAQADAYNTALLFVKMEKEPTLRLNPYYIKETPRKTVYNPFADLLANYNFAG